MLIPQKNPGGPLGGRLVSNYMTKWGSLTAWLGNYRTIVSPCDLVCDIDSKICKG